MIAYNKYKTKDDKFGCHYCKGKGKIIYDCDSKKRKTEITCGFCDGTGYLVSALEFSLNSQQAFNETLKKAFDYLQNFIRETSTCTKCKGNQENTPGGIKCEECGLKGTMPWGG